MQKITLVNSRKNETQIAKVEGNKNSGKKAMLMGCADEMQKQAGPMLVNSRKPSDKVVMRDASTVGFYIFRGPRADKGNKRGPNKRTLGRTLVTA